jgi:hypothetical protein
MMVFNLNDVSERRDFARVLADFQGYGVEYKLSYDSTGLVYVTPTGARQ